MDLTYTDNGTGLKNFAFVQYFKIGHKVPREEGLEGVDPTHGNHNYPFYWEKDELEQYTNADGSVRFWDTALQSLQLETFAHFELSVVGMNSAGKYVPIITITWGYEIHNGEVHVDPWQTVSPSDNQMNVINSIKTH
jgi:hypothetical protein